MATNEIFYDKAHAKIEYLANGHYLRMVWSGFVSFTNFKEALNALLTFAEKDATIVLFLSDQRKRKVLTPEEGEWFAKDFAPRFIKSRTKPTKLAIIKSEDTFGKISTTNIMNKVVSLYKHDLTEYAYFEDEITAMNWLEIKNN